jgi:hypothetical protein
VTHGEKDLEGVVGHQKGEHEGTAGRPVLDIEHMPCDDDPREWSPRKKNFVLAIMTIAVVRN